MNSQDIHLTDPLRILIGEVPLSYFIELVIRAAAVYLILMISMRSMGKRMSSQLSRNELAALVSLAAAVGVPMMAPDRGLLPAVIIAFVLITIERAIAKQGCKSEAFESFAQGRLSILVRDGVVCVKELEQVSLSHERLFAQLRSNGVLQLGTVARFYMEANGNFSLVTSSNPQPGLSVLPPWDDELRDFFHEHPENKVCGQCGLQQSNTRLSDKACPNCKTKRWVTAVEIAKVSNKK